MGRISGRAGDAGGAKGRAGATMRPGYRSTHACRLPYAGTKRARRRIYASLVLLLSETLPQANKRGFVHCQTTPWRG